MDPPRPHLLAYYQTFCGLSRVLALQPQPLSDLHVAALHCGRNADGTPYLHLNDLPPDDPAFDAVWTDLAAAKAQGITVRAMFGGAGGGFAALFADYGPCLALLLAFLRARASIISGLDIDVEEPVDSADLQRLIGDVAAALPQLDFTMAPLGASLSADVPGMGGFVYKAFLATPEGRRVVRLNAQCYGAPADQALPPMVANGYAPAGLLVGALGSQSDTQPAALERMVRACPGAGGGYLWELAEALPSPEAWAVAARQALDAARLAP